MDLVFLIGAGVIVIVVAFVMLLFLPEIPLGTQSAMAARPASSPTGELPVPGPVR